MTRIKQVKHGPVIVLTVQSPLLGEMTNTLREKLQACLEAGELQLILDFQAVAYIDSAALSMLLITSRLTRHKGGALKIAYVTGVCHDVFVATRLEPALEIYPDMHSALRSFL